MTIFASVRQFIAWADSKGLPHNRSAAALFCNTELRDESNPDHRYRVMTYALTR